MFKAFGQQLAGLSGKPSLGHGLGIRYASSIMGSLKPAAGATSNTHRVGRGPGSGRGKTAGRGTKGQWARAKVKPWFEGGQTPLYKLFPKVGFKSKLAKPQYLNLNRLQDLIDSGRIDASKPITMKELYRSRYFGTLPVGVKLLAGEFDRFHSKVNISVSKASALAIQKIEELGGSITTQYYTKFGLRVLTRPEATVEKFGRLPLRARPVDRRNIEYYRDETRRGYLVGTPNAPRIKQKYTPSPKVSPLVATLEQLQAVESSHYSVGASQGFFRHHKA